MAPIILIVPGSFCPPEEYDPVVAGARAKGIDIRAIPLVTAGKKPGELPTMYDDADSIAKEIEKEADAGKDVVVMSHSYGGTPASQLSKEFTKAEREKAGKKGGLVRLAFMTAVVPYVGASAGSFMAEGNAPGGYTAPDEDGWLYHPDPALTASYVFNEKTPEDGAKRVVDAFVQHSSVSFVNELTCAGYANVPSSWLFCDKDLCVPPNVQHAGIDAIEKASGKKVDVRHIDNDHVPNESAPEKVIDWFVHLSELGGKETT